MNRKLDIFKNKNITSNNMVLKSIANKIDKAKTKFERDNIVSCWGSVINNNC